MKSFGDRLAEAVLRTGNPVCVGLDPRWESLPDSIRATHTTDLPSRAKAFEAFCHDIIDVVKNLVPIVKLQAAFFEELGAPGMGTMASVIDYAVEHNLLVIVDGKRNDIGSTAEAYARAYLGHESTWHSDALTVSPYLGNDSLEPFVQIAEKCGGGIFVLVKTSNPGGGMLQDLACDNQTIYSRVAHYVQAMSAKNIGEHGYGSIGAVVGATYPGQLEELRSEMPHSWLLVPGFGAQGGTASDVKPAFDSRGLGAIINNSRGIIFAHNHPEFAANNQNWQATIEAATRQMIDQLATIAPIHR